MSEHFNPEVWPAFCAKADQLWGAGHETLPDDEWGVFHDTATEVHRQDSKWGPQSHSLVGGEYPDLLIHTYRECAEEWKARNDSRVRAGVIGWDGILLEEVFEALECDNVEAATGELVQVMAVCAQMILDLRSRGSAQVSPSVPNDDEDGVL